MIIYPAIDLKDGKCVRLVKGEMDSSTVFSDDPAAQAKSFEEQGAQWIHIVDLNGAFEGRPANIRAVQAILDAVSVPVQLGGGIRNMGMVNAWLKAGVARVILGTVALHNPELVKEACREHPGRIAVGIDARGGNVAVEGWAETSEINVLELADKFADVGVSAIIYTDIERDGILVGPDIKGTKELAEHTSIPVIASGGVGTIDDVKAVMKLEKSGVAGLIIGRAIYEGAVELTRAIEIAEAA